MAWDAFKGIRLKQLFGVDMQGCWAAEAAKHSPIQADRLMRIQRPLSVIGGLTVGAAVRFVASFFLENARGEPGIAAKLCTIHPMYAASVAPRGMGKV